jgi:hypothetical protein
MPEAPELVCVGHLVRETIHFPDRIEGPLLGSPPAYCSLAAAAQGTRTGIVTRIGPQLSRQLLAPRRRGPTRADVRKRFNEEG